MKKQLYLLSSLFALLLVACEEVIEIDLNSSAPVVVAEGMIRNDSAAWLKLSYTSDYFEAEESVKISDALVRISDDAGNEATLTALGDGNYEAPQFFGVIGRTYTLDFSHKGEDYEARSTLMSPTKILDVSFEKIEMGVREQMTGVENYRPTVLIADHPEEDNFYRFKFFVDGEEQGGIFLTTDRTAEAGKLEYSPLRMVIEGGGEVRVEAFSIDEASYTYYSQLDDLSADMMGSSTPYNPQSNFGKEVMGFFAALSSDSYIAEIK